ncbi:tRNA pseudouridine synthase A [Pontibacillus halophilus JSM 076056 = DSM 19796]|uniref:tRNA pseudouridine synthase A n=1 Tax=Pontibacillus halophilus JSM 076056 = DSM 19796 TaxID=1385510 RepID=A0A0A5I3E4_9BACI|nr:tRNA pseudouridine synthase A [Pontibacillus halophilus JSM 076056 = DSM 19796]
MERVICVISYDGTQFSGYQVQPNGRTVQEDVENALQKMHKGKFIRITASGRTDAGVHAKGQVIHFDSPLVIPEENWKKALQTLLPKDIRIVDVQKTTEDFHARYGTKRKEYRYRILNSVDPDVFKRNYTFHVPDKLDLQAMNEACTYFEGTHDFTSFSSAKSDVKGDKVRTIYEAYCYVDGDEIIFSVTGNGFLYNMVRILVGTLLEVGKGRKTPATIQEIFEMNDRSQAGKTAPPQGLYLWDVDYNEKQRSQV